MPCNAGFEIQVRPQRVLKDLSSRKRTEALHSVSASEVEPISKDKSGDLAVEAHSIRLWTRLSPVTGPELKEANNGQFGQKYASAFAQG